MASVYDNFVTVLGRLIGFDTTSAVSNVPLIEYAADYLAKCSLPKEHIRILKTKDGKYANLFATLPAADGSTKGGIILSGHCDCVPVTNQNWTMDPFKLTEKDGKLYGRGTSDMKGYLGLVLALVPYWLTQPLAKPIHVVFTHNEETTMQGVRELLAFSKSDLADVEGCIIGEPTSLQVVVANKGICHNHVHCKGKPAHSSAQESGVNALDTASSFIRLLFEMRERFVKEGPHAEGFLLPYTTVCPSMISGGIATNVVPEDIDFYYEYRLVPGHTQGPVDEEISNFMAKENEKLKAKDPTCGVKQDRISNVLPFQGKPDSSVIKTLNAITGKTEADFGRVNYVTEAGEYQLSGINTVVWGPGDIEQAHRPDEFVSVEQFKRAEVFLRKAIQNLCFKNKGESQI